MILLVVDTQKAITNSGLYNFDILESNIEKLIETARNHGTEVIFVRHDDGAGELTRGNEGFEIYSGFQPRNDEKVFDKTVNSAFKGTGLTEYLRQKGEDTIIIVGLQTDYCIDATIKAGFEHGFAMIVPENTNSTFDNDYISAELTYNYYNNLIWKNRYARCVAFEVALEMLENNRE